MTKEEKKIIVETDGVAFLDDQEMIKQRLKILNITRDEYLRNIQEARREFDDSIKKNELIFLKKFYEYLLGIKVKE